MKNLIWLSVVFCLIFISCKKDSNDGKGINHSDFYAELVIDGDTVTMQERVNGYTNVPGSGGGVADTAGNYLFRQFTQYSSANDTLRIYFIDIFSSTPNQSEKEGIIHTGTYPTGYGAMDAIAPDASLKAGAAIVYIDANGTRWSTDRNPELQPNWSFNVTKHENNSVDGYSKYLTDMDFTARLYNAQTGNYVDVSVIKLRGRTVIP